MDDARLQELRDREEIKELKARYWRCVDSEDWDGFRQVLADDVHFELPGGEPIEGGDTFAAFVRASTEGCWKTHHGHMPEITFDGPSEAHGIWALNDYKLWPSDGDTGERHGFEGYGHYRESYIKVEARWLIRWLTVTYIRMDPLYPAPPGEQVLDGRPTGGHPVLAPPAGPGPEAPLADASVQTLADREAIKQLKARYFETVDRKDWDGFRALLADDGRFELLGTPPIEGADAFVAFAREGLADALTVHHGHNLQIAVDGPAAARGSWVLFDYIEWPADPATGARRGSQGYGRYDEAYRKIDGLWKIASWRLGYRRNDALTGPPLPAVVTDATVSPATGDAQLRPGGTDDAALAQELLDREAIAELKARSFRLLDARDWGAWRELFTEDCEHHVAAVQERLADAVTVHHGHMPSITIDGPDIAHATWSVADYVEWPADPDTGARCGTKGYGHDRDTYRRVEGRWQIAGSLRSALRVDPLPAQALPDRVQGRPAKHIALSSAAAQHGSG